MPQRQRSRKSPVVEVPSSITSSLSLSQETQDPSKFHLGQQAILSADTQTVKGTPIPKDFSQDDLHDLISYYAIRTDDPVTSASALDKLSLFTTKFAQESDFAKTNAALVSIFRCIILTAIVQNDLDMVEDNLFHEMCSKSAHFELCLPQDGFLESNHSNSPQFLLNGANYYHSLAGFYLSRANLMILIHDFIKRYHLALSEQTCRFYDLQDRSEAKGFRRMSKLVATIDDDAVQNFITSNVGDIFTGHGLPYFQYDDTTDEELSSDQGIPTSYQLPPSS